MAVVEGYHPVGGLDALREAAAAGGAGVPVEVNTDGVLAVWCPASSPAPHHASGLHFLVQVDLDSVN